jgi:hypothetical protein
MFSEKTISIINSIKAFGEHRKGVMRIYYPDGEYEDLAAAKIKQMEFIDFAKIAVRLDGIKIPQWVKLGDRNGKIEEFSPNHWQVYCGECGLVYARPFVTYQDASIWFTMHLEARCETNLI